MFFFDSDSIFFSILGYSMSYLEFFGTLAGGIAVWLSAKGNIWSWFIGILNVVLFFFLFFQVQLYPDMFLQIFFLITNLIGWWRWAHPLPGEEDRKKELRPSWMPLTGISILTFIIFAGMLSFGNFASNLHMIFPKVFNLPSAFPYLDSFVLSASIAATYLMIQKKVECWLVWIITDVIATYLYFAKGILLVGMEYLIFCLIASFGFWNWRNEAKAHMIELGQQDRL